MALMAEIEHLYNEIRSLTDTHVNWEIKHTIHPDGSVYYTVERDGNRFAYGTLTDLATYKVFLYGIMAGMALNRG